MDETVFVLRRAWLVGRCRRADVDRAIGTDRSPNRASKILQRAVSQWSHELYRSPRIGVFPNRRIPVPDLVRAETILGLLASGASPQESGLFPDDGVPILRPHPPPARAGTAAATGAVLDAAVRGEPVEILYVGLRRGESARWRTVWPRALEFTGMFWRIHAQDLEDAQAHHPLKTFVLARVLDARPATDWREPAGFVPRALVRDRRRLRVHLSDALTADQATAVRNQLDIQDGVMTWPDHALHTFRREFTALAVPADVVWPVITRLEED